MATRKEKRAAKRVTTTTPETRDPSTVTTRMEYREDDDQEALRIYVRPYEFEAHLDEITHPNSDGKTIIATAIPGGLAGLMRVRDTRIVIGDVNMRALHIVSMWTAPEYNSEAIDRELVRWLLAVVDMHNVVLWRSMREGRALLLGNEHAIVSAVIAVKDTPVWPRVQKFVEFGGKQNMGLYSLIPGVTVSTFEWVGQPYWVLE